MPSDRVMRSASQKLERIPLDAALVGIVGVVQVGGSVWVAHLQDEGQSINPAGLVLLCLGPLALLWRRRLPLAVLAVTLVTTLVYWIADYPRGPAFLALMMAFANAVILGHRAAAWLTMASCWAGLMWLPSLLGDGESPSLAKALGAAAWLFVFGAVVELVAFRKERMREADRARRQEEIARAGQERLRIARELHDVLAHNVSLINVQAGSALHLLDDDPARARPALEAIKEASAQTLREVRSVLEILRRPGEEPPLSPTVGLAGIDELIARTSAAGIPVERELRGAPRALPAPVDLAVYRVVQEALTNVARHARPASATVRLTFADDAVTLEVEDDGPGPNGAGAGNGIAGMRERVAALGGEFSAAARPEAGFRVAARLPLGGGA